MDSPLKTEIFGKVFKPQLSDKRLKPFDRDTMTYLRIMSHDGRRRCFPGEVKIAHDLGVSVRSMKRSIIRCFLSGWLTPKTIRTGRVTRRNEYAFTWPSWYAPGGVDIEKRRQKWNLFRVRYIPKKRKVFEVTELAPRILMVGDRNGT